MEREAKEVERGWWHSCHVSRRNHVLTEDECPRCGQKKPGSESDEKKEYTPEPLRRVYPREAFACHTCGRRLLKNELYVVGKDKGIRCIECIFPEMLESLELRAAVACRRTCDGDAGLHTGACDQAMTIIAKAKGQA